jgi:uncharacterized protein (DUF983 family)
MKKAGRQSPVSEGGAALSNGLAAKCPKTYNRRLFAAQDTFAVALDLGFDPGRDVDAVQMVLKMS